MTDEVKNEGKEQEETFEVKTTKTLDAILKKLETTENKTKELENKLKSANLYKAVDDKSKEEHKRLIDDIK